ncbi:MAG: heavy-metal-associated domain-containing protein [Ruminococcaceae bacterium]|nr:heavy-metal-associated domain-containing protein [Oscillospiraceae bacterium]
MKKTFSLIDLDCAHCAARMEDGIRRIKGVDDVSVSFLTQKLTLEADDAVFEKVLKQAVKICRKIEPDCTVVME